MRDANRLLKYWGDCPPQHVAVVQLRNIVITAFGGTPPEPNGSRKLTTADEWSALAVSLGK